MNIVFDLELYLRRIRLRVGPGNTVSIGHPAEVAQLRSVPWPDLQSAARLHGLRVVERMEHHRFDFMRGAPLESDS